MNTQKDFEIAWVKNELNSCYGWRPTPSTWIVFDENVRGSYMGDKTPIWCYDSF